MRSSSEEERVLLYNYGVTMKSILFALTASAALLIAVPSFACDGHAKAEGEETTKTANAESCGCDSCASDKDCASCEKCAKKEKKEETQKKS